jgi:hypothetical protein
VFRWKESRNQYYRIAWAGTVLKKPKFGEVQSG